MKLYESGENYLEAILILTKEKGYVRSVDLALKMNFSKASISRAISKFKENNLVVVSQDGLIFLTENGREVAKKIYERHCFLYSCFKFLGVCDDVAKKDACRLEHAMSQETFEKLKEYFEPFIKNKKIEKNL